MASTSTVIDMNIVNKIIDNNKNNPSLNQNSQLDPYKPKYADVQLTDLKLNDSTINYSNINYSNINSKINESKYDSKNNLNLDKIKSYDAIQVETENLLKREKTLFMINSVVTFGLLITVFKVL